MSRYLNSPREADWYACPTCGDEVRVGSAGCRKCRPESAGPQDREKAGGAEGEWPDGLDLPEAEEEFDYEEWKKREFGSAAKVKPHHLPWKYWLAGVLLLLAMTWTLVVVAFGH